MDTPDPFSEFSTAAQVNGGRIDILDDIQSWLKGSHAKLAAIRANYRAIGDEGQRLLGDDASTYKLAKGGDTDEYAKGIWESAMIYFESRFVQPKGIELPVCAEAFVFEAVGGDRDSWIGRRSRDDEKPLEDRLLVFDAAKVRAYFEKTFSDVREAAVAQLRKKALDFLEYDSRPTPRMELHCHIHRTAYKKGFMGHSIWSESSDKLTHFFQYIIYLATGEVPAKNAKPSFFGFNDGGHEYERAELFKRQIKPFVGVQWLRFTACGRLEIVLEPAVLARLQSQWDDVVGGAQIEAALDAILAN